MPICRVLACFFCVFLLTTRLPAQRGYRASSVLSSGNWYRIAVKGPGIYRIDLPYLSNLGISTSNLASTSVRLFGNGGQMLAEANVAPWTDDLVENAIQVIDGGDGILNGTDYILFYANGPDRWIKDSINQRFTHQKNLYSDKSFYFLTIGGAGKRVAINPVVNAPNISVTNFQDRFFHERDTVNFLASGREWYGEEFADMPGKTITRDFVIPFPDVVTGSSLTLRTHLIARSIGAPSRFDTRVNSQPVAQTIINPTTAGTYDPFAKEAITVSNTVATQNNVSVNFTYAPGSFNSQGWLNWFELFVRRQLNLQGVQQLSFRDWTSVGPGNIAGYVISNGTSTTQVWDITDPVNAQQVQGILTGSEYRFSNNASMLREYIAFGNTGFLTPEALGRINNQDLHNTSPKDYLIVSWPGFVSQAERLAQFHRQRGLRVLVVTTDQIFNEFGSGTPDPVSIRDFAKMYHDKYGAIAADKPKYLLLFGDASYDFMNRISNNTNFVPAWENYFSLDPLSTYASDDFYGFLDDNEDINAGLIINYLDLGIGRVPAKNLEEATNFVDKVFAYTSQPALGPWRNNISFIADDEDFNLHLQDAEIFSATTAAAVPAYNQQKFYLDAFRQETGSGGSRYPQANIAINNQVYTGMLIWNYNGHGGARRLAEETILDQEIVNNWNNPTKLPLFITATCDFAPYDNPAINSIGENILLRPKTGGIALMTTTRVVFAFSNRIMNDNYLRIALQPDANGKFKSLGEAMMAAKNFTYQTSGDITNNRKFTLLGDPALTLAFPAMRVRATRVNGIDISTADTLSATEKVLMEGEVTDLQGNLLSGFSGSVYPVIFDKPQTITTLANDPQSLPVAFTTQTNILFRGKATVTNGRFSFSFKVPKDINYQYGQGKLSLYAENGNTDANGAFNNFIIGGAGAGIDNDKQGPEIKAWLNDERFVNGGITNENPILILKLADSSGINTVGTGIGHDIIATLDDDNNRYFLLNDFYQGDPDSYQKGEVRFQLPPLEPGPHTLRIKAWDVVNNSNEILLEFTVANDDELQLDHVLNYPNPFTTNTQFWFEHNKPGQQLYTRLTIMTITGKMIKQISRSIITDGNRSTELEWDGRDEFGDRPGRGVYLYKLSVELPGKKRKEVIGKLMML